MKEILLQYAAYNLWANQRLTDFLKNLEEKTLQKEVPSSFTSVQKTLLHMLDAESIWWQRLKQQEKIVRPSDSTFSSTGGIISSILKLDQEWIDWIEHAAEKEITAAFTYQNSSGQQFSQPVYQMMLHLFNHSTYHRGQLVTMLHQLEISSIPATDFIVFSRS